MKKFFYGSLMFLNLFLLGATELPNIEPYPSDVQSAFQDILDYAEVSGDGVTTDAYFSYPELGTGIYLLDALLESFSYNTTKQRIEQICATMNEIIDSGSLSKMGIETFRSTMSNTYWLRSNMRNERNFVQETVAELEQQITHSQGMIETYRSYLANMQTPEELKEMETDERAYVEQLRSEKKYTEESIRKYEVNITKILHAYYEAVDYEKDLNEKIGDLTDDIENYKKDIVQVETQAVAQSKKELVDKINGIQTWIDFFEGKNTLVTDYLKLTRTREALFLMIDNHVPMKDVEEYTQKVETFCTEWGL